MSENRQSGGVLDRRLIVILLIVFVQIVGASMVLPILPLYAKREFGMSPATITLLNTAFFAAQFIAGPFLGRLSDHYGRIPVLIVSQIGTVIAFLMLGFAPAVWMLFFARILDGITGGNIIVAQAYVTDITPRDQRTQALGYIFLAFGVGFIIGPAMGGILATTFTYQTPYLFAAAVAAIVVILTWTVLEETVTSEQQVANRKAPARELSFAGIISNVPMLVILGTAFSAQFAFSMFQATFALFGEAVIFNQTPEQADLGIGLLLAMVGVGQIFTQGFLLKRLVARFGDAPLVIIGGFFRALSMLVLIVIAIPASAALSLFLYAVGAGTQMPALQSLITNTVPDGQRGGVLGLYQSTLSLSIIFGSAIAGWLFEIQVNAPYILSAVIFVAVIIPGPFLVRWAREQASSKPDPTPVVSVGP